MLRPRAQFGFASLAAAVLLAALGSCRPEANPSAEADGPASDVTPPELHYGNAFVVPDPVHVVHVEGDGVEVDVPTHRHRGARVVPVPLLVTSEGKIFEGLLTFRGPDGVLLSAKVSRAHADGMPGTSTRRYLGRLASLVDAPPPAAIDEEAAKRHDADVRDLQTLVGVVTEQVDDAASAPRVVGSVSGTDVVFDSEALALLDDLLEGAREPVLAIKRGSALTDEQEQENADAIRTVDSMLLGMINAKTNGLLELIAKVSTAAEAALSSISLHLNSAAGADASQDIADLVEAAKSRDEAGAAAPSLGSLAKQAAAPMKGDAAAPAQSSAGRLAEEDDSRSSCANWCGTCCTGTGLACCGTCRPQAECENHDAPPNDGPPSCTAPLSACGTRCVDLDGDRLNCGRCGHSCAGGFCDHGTCLARLINLGQGTIDRMAVGGQSVFVHEPKTGEIRMLAKLSDSTEVVRAISAGQPTVANMVVVKDHVYWTGMQSRALSGELVDTVRWAGPGCRGFCYSTTNEMQTRGPALAADATFGYVSINGGDFASFQSNSNTGTAGQDYGYDQKGVYHGGYSYALAADGHFIYSFEVSQSSLDLWKYVVRPAGYVSQDRDGAAQLISGIPAVKVSDFPELSASADGNWVYWIGPAGSVQYLPVNGGAIATVPGAVAKMITAGKGGVFGVDTAGGSVWNFDPATMKAPRVLASHLKSPTAITSDEAIVYFATSGDGGVYRVAK